MIAYTIGVGDDYYSMAKKAAEAVRYFTGLETVIQTHVPDGMHPALHKLWLFDHVQGPVLFFDADTRSIDYWDDVLDYSERRHFVAVVNPPHDRVLYECLKHGLDEETYFNSGMFIANYDHHALVFDRAKRIVKREDFHSPFYDQTPLNIAMKQTQTPVTLLPQRYNQLFIDVGKKQNHVEDMKRRLDFIARMSEKRKRAINIYSQLVSALPDDLWLTSIEQDAETFTVSGRVKGSFPEGETFPLNMRARAFPPSMPG